MEETHNKCPQQLTKIGLSFTDCAVRAVCKAAQIKLDASGNSAQRNCLPTGVCLDPAGRSFAAGNMPLAMVLSPEGDRLILSLNGWRQQGLQVIDRHMGTVIQTISQPGAFLGLAFSSDGATLYASGGNEDVVYRYAWRDKRASLIDGIVLAPKEPKKDGTRYPAGIALSPDGKAFVCCRKSRRTRWP
jgi:hypothetical protein